MKRKTLERWSPLLLLFAIALIACRHLLSELDLYALHDSILEVPQPALLGALGVTVAGFIILLMSAVYGLSMFMAPWLAATLSSIGWAVATRGAMVALTLFLRPRRPCFPA